MALAPNFPSPEGVFLLLAQASRCAGSRSQEQTKSRPQRGTLARALVHTLLVRRCPRGAGNAAVLTPPLLLLLLLLLFLLLLLLLVILLLLLLPSSSFVGRDASSAWFGDVLSQTWGQDPEKKAAAERAAAAAEAERLRLANHYPRVITGEELASFGVSGTGRAAQLKRQFRQVTAARALRPVAKGDIEERPEMLGQRGGPPPREWVLVAKDELAELHALETMLRSEKTLVGAQAALTLNRAQVSACDPLPMAKMAVEDVCNREMKRARVEVERLSAERRGKRVARETKSIGYEMGKGGPAPALRTVTMRDSSSTLSTASDLRDGSESVGTLTKKGCIAVGPSFETLVIPSQQQRRHNRKRGLGALSPMGALGNFLTGAANREVRKAIPGRLLPNDLAAGLGPHITFSHVVLLSPFSLLSTPPPGACPARAGGADGGAVPRAAAAPPV